MIPMNFALVLPDWNSLDSVRAAHNSLELWSIWLFAVLVVCDVIAHLVEDNRKATAKALERIGLCCFAVAVVAELGAYKYGERNDALSQQVITSLDIKAKNAFDNASAALTKSEEAKTAAGSAQTKADAVGRKTDALDVRISKAGDDLTRALERTKMLESQLAWRTVTPEQKEKLRTLLISRTQMLVPLSNLKIGIEYVNQNPESEEYAHELKDALDGLGAEIPEPNGAEFIGSKTLQGLIVEGNPYRNPRATLLLNAIHDSGIAVVGTRLDELGDRGISIIVGSKPRDSLPKQ